VAWKNNYKKDWLASPEFRRVTWIEVEAPLLRRAYDDTYWPVPLRPIRDQLPKKSGTPRFLIVEDGKVISNQFGGSSAWKSTLADLEKVLAR